MYLEEVETEFGEFEADLGSAAFALFLQLFEFLAGGEAVGECSFIGLIFLVVAVA